MNVTVTRVPDFAGGKPFSGLKPHDDVAPGMCVEGERVPALTDEFEFPPALGK